MHFTIETAKVDPLAERAVAPACSPLAPIHAEATAALERAVADASRYSSEAADAACLEIEAMIRNSVPFSAVRPATDFRVLDEEKLPSSFVPAQASHSEEGMVFSPVTSDGFTVRVEARSPFDWRLIFERVGGGETFKFSVEYPGEHSLEAWRHLAAGREATEIGYEGYTNLSIRGGAIVFEVADGPSSEWVIPLEKVAPQLSRALDAASAAGFEFGESSRECSVSRALDAARAAGFEFGERYSY